MVFISRPAWQNSQSREVPPLKRKRAHQKKGRVEKKKPQRLGLAVLISAIIVAVVILDTRCSRRFNRACLAQAEVRRTLSFQLSTRKGSRRPAFACRL